MEFQPLLPEVQSGVLDDPTRANTGAMPPLPATGFVRRPVAKAFAGIAADSTFYGLIAKGLFPRPVKLAGARGRASAWDVGELRAWAVARIAERDNEVMA